MMNPMREIRIQKVTINMGCGEAGEKLDKAKKLLAAVINKKIVTTSTSGRTTFGMPAGRAIGCKTTLRGQDAEDFLKRAFEAADGKLLKRVFDRQGNFSFGVKEHISLPGVRYDPEIGIFGMDVCVTLERRGYRVARKRMPSRVSKTHAIRPDEAMDWTVKKFGIKVE